MVSGKKTVSTIKLFKKDFCSWDIVFILLNEIEVLYSQSCPKFDQCMLEIVEEAPL